MRGHGFPARFARPSSLLVASNDTMKDVVAVGANGTAVVAVADTGVDDAVAIIVDAAAALPATSTSSTIVFAHGAIETWRACAGNEEIEYCLLSLVHSL